LCPLSGVLTSNFNNIYTYKAAATWMVEFSYTATESLPAAVTSLTLMASPTYMLVKKTGFASALNAVGTAGHAVSLSDNSITGCTVNAANVVQQYSVARQAADTRIPYSVTTTGTVQVASESEAKALASTIKGAVIAAEISRLTNSASAVADWSGEPLLSNMTPTGRKQGFVEGVVDGQGVVIEATSGGSLNSVFASGDPHMTSVTGAKFDILRSGNHTMLHIPQHSREENALVFVRAFVKHEGAACLDMYIESLHITGKWAEERQRGGFSFFANQSGGASKGWLSLGKLDLQVVYGTTVSGVRYLNMVATHLAKLGMPIGGILGLDGHESAATPEPGCQRRVDLVSFPSPAEESGGQASWASF
jgi:hypothetical protein